MPRFAVLMLVLAGSALAGNAPPKDGKDVAKADSSKLSDAVTAPRPAEGEYFGLYLVSKKVGYLFSQILTKGDTLVAVNDYHFIVIVGTRRSEKILTETKTYESKPGGKLLSFTLVQSGDGGEQVLEATANATGLRVLRKRPGNANETLTVKAALETVEDADQARVALKRNAKVEGTITDSTDLKMYKLTSTPMPAETRMIGGVKATLRKVITISDKENVPTEAWFDEKGRIVEVQFGASMTASAESAETAKRVEAVELFGLTRVVLPKPAPADARNVPGQLTLIVKGLPEKFRTDSYRQKYKQLDKDRVEVTLLANPPKKKSPRPLIDPNGGSNLESDIIVESDNPEIRTMAKKIIGDEKDAYTAAKKINAWVFKNVQSDYGSSSDRATDVLKTLKGDCTEHALLAVSLLRAVGIPAKRIDGIVYVMNEDNVPALYWHEWVQAYVGEWTQLDPTFNQEVADATHFALGEESRAEITPLIGSLKVEDVH